MAQDNSDTPPPRGLSSFANLLGSNAGTISSAPVMYNQQPGPEDSHQDAPPARKQQLNSALRFQPTKRPQIQSQKKTKPAFPKPNQPLQSSSSPDPHAQSNKPSQAPSIVALAANPPSKASLADFLNDDGDDGFYAATQPRERGGRKRKKKKKQQQYEQQEQNWDDIYDPTRPNDFNQYKGSEEQMREIAEWKDLLYRHKTKRELSKEDPESDEEDYQRSRMKPQFAPPKSYNFAPPSEFNTPTPPAPSVPAEIPDDPTGDDAYARRMRLSGLGAPPPPPQEAAGTPPPPLNAAPPALPGAPPAGTISRAPVRYDVLAPTANQPSEAEEVAPEEAANPDSDTASRSKTPGQKGFAQRIMEKYGWEKGKGLGANETGIITPLQMKAEKRKHLPDAQGGGWASRGRMGKITGGKKANITEDEGKHGKMSSVVVMINMLVGMDLDQELGEGNLMQEIGEELDKAGGRVDRIYIDRYTMANDFPVFAKFTNQLSALRAVNAMDGRVFNGNTIRARYFDEDKFEKGDYKVDFPEDQGEKSG